MIFFCRRSLFWSWTYQSDVYVDPSRGFEKNPTRRWVAEKVFKSITSYKPNCIQQVEISPWARHHLGSQTHTEATEAGTECCPVSMGLPQESPWASATSIRNPTKKVAARCFCSQFHLPRPFPLGVIPSYHLWSETRQGPNCGLLWYFLDSISKFQCGQRNRIGGDLISPMIWVTDFSLHLLESGVPMSGR